MVAAKLTYKQRGHPLACKGTLWHKCWSMMPSAPMCQYTHVPPFGEMAHAGMSRTSLREEMQADWQHCALPPPTHTRTHPNTHMCTKVEASLKTNCIHTTARIIHALDGICQHNMDTSHQLYPNNRNPCIHHHNIYVHDTQSGLSKRHCERAISHQPLVVHHQIHAQSSRDVSYTLLVQCSC